MVLRSFEDRVEVFTVLVPLSLSLGRIQPLSGIKLVIPLFAASYLRFFDLLSWRSGHPLADSYRYLSTGIKAFVVMVGLTIIHIFTVDLSTICYYLCSSPKVHWKNHKKSYSLLAVLLSLCCCVHQVASHHLYIYCIVFHLLSAPLLV